MFSILDFPWLTVQVINSFLDVKNELESIGRCLKGEELVKALMERVIAAEEEKATLSRKVEELSKAQKEASTLRKQNELVR